MAGPGSVRVPPDSTGKIVDGRSLSVGGVTVIRQTVVVGDPTSSAGFASVSAGRLQTFAVVAAGAAHIGEVSVVGTVAVGSIAAGVTTIGVVLAGAGTAHIGEVSVVGTVAVGSIAAGVTTIGVVLAGAGTAHIGEVSVVGTVAVGSIAAGVTTVGAVFAIGTNQDGLSATAAPVLVGGRDSAGGGLVRTFLTDSSGRQFVNVSGFIDPSGTSRNVVDSTNLALRVTIAALSAATLPVSGTVNVNGAVGISGGVVLSVGANSVGIVTVGNFVDPSGTQRNVVDSVNTALRVNVVAGGAGGGAVFGQVSAGASLSVTNIPVLMGGNDSVGGGIARTLLLDTGGRILLGAGALSVGIVTVGNFIDASGTVKNVVDSVNTALRVTIAALSAATLPVSGTVNVNGGVAISGTALIAGAVTFAAASAAVSVNGTVAVSGNFSSTAVAICQGAVSHSAAVAIATNFPVLMGLRAANSATVGVAHHNATFAWGDAFGRQVVIQNNPSALVSNSQGPRTVFASSSANVALVAAPAADFCIYVTHLMATNGSATLTRGEVYSGTNTASSEVKAYLAASGGGFTRDFNPPWKLQTATALNCRVEPNASKCLFEVHFYVAPK